MQEFFRESLFIEGLSKFPVKKMFEGNCPLMSVNALYCQL